MDELLAIYERTPTTLKKHLMNSTLIYQVQKLYLDGDSIRICRVIAGDQMNQDPVTRTWSALQGRWAAPDLHAGNSPLMPVP